MKPNNRNVTLKLPDYLLFKNFYRVVLIFFAILGSAFGSRSVFALDCSQVNQLTKSYFNIHFSFSKWTDELSGRTLENFIKAWDSGKIYFLKSDVERFVKDYGSRLDDMISANDCKAITDISNVFGQRFSARQSEANRQIMAKHDFKVDEYLQLDRKELPWAATSEEVNERWRKRIKFQLLQLTESLDSQDKAREKLKKRYALGAKRQSEMTMDDIYSLFLASFATALDPHSGYLSAEELEDFRIQTRLSLDGIGAVLRSEDGFTTIQTIVPGGAAAETGKFQVDDKIIAVAQGKEPPVDVIDMDLREVVKLIRGTRGTEVRLTILRETKGKNVQLVIPVIRNKIQLTDRAAKSRVQSVEVDEGGKKSTYKIGVITLPSFYMDFEGRQNRESNFTSSSVDMARELKKMRAKGAQAIIVDLRSNGGGSLDEAINVAGLFTGQGPQVQIRGSDGKTFVSQYKRGAAAWDGPLTVLINRQSASASEIFAGAIQDYKRGLIVGGHHTFGKGTVQNLENLDERLGAIKVTISKFYRPGGSSTQLRGVEADIVLPDLMDELEFGEKYYDYALSWEKIDSSEFKNYGLTDQVIPALRTASHARLDKDPGFQKILSDIKEYREGEASRSRVSLMAKSESKSKAGSGRKKGKHGSDSDSGDDENEPGVYSGDDLDISDDFTLQESLKITGNYLQLLEKKPLTAEVTLKGLKPSRLLTGSALPKESKRDGQVEAPKPHQRPSTSGTITTPKVKAQKDKAEKTK